MRGTVFGKLWKSNVHKLLSLINLSLLWHQFSNTMLHFIWFVIRSCKSASSFLTVFGVHIQSSSTLGDVYKHLTLVLCVRGEHVLQIKNLLTFKNFFFFLNSGKFSVQIPHGFTLLWKKMSQESRKFFGPLQ